MDTRTPNRFGGGYEPAGDGGPAAATRVPSDPARIAGSGVSFRVRLAPPETPNETSLSGIPIIPGSGAAAVGRRSAALGQAGVVAGSGTAVARPPRRRVVLPGQAHGAAEVGAALLAGAGAGVRRAGGGPGYDDGEITRAMPMPGVEAAAPTVLPGGARVLKRHRPAAAAPPPLPDPSATAVMPPVRIARPPEPSEPGPTETTGAFQRLSGLHAWYPGRRMNLGLVLLPLRILLGVMLVGAGVAKLTDPVYFDGGARGSMMHWLLELRPWSLAAPLVDYAIAHPVGAGLAVAFVQIAVGALSVLGLWQRVSAAIGMLLSVALLVTVAWRAAPVYDTPDVLYLAAWSPLLIAGAPLFSLDSRLAAEAWRRFQPRPEVWQLRRRVALRGAPMVALVLGLTLLLGAGLGASTRSARPADRGPGLPDQRPAPSVAPVPGGVRPGSGGAERPSAAPRPSAKPSHSAKPSRSPRPSRSPGSASTPSAPAPATGQQQGTSTGTAPSAPPARHGGGTSSGGQGSAPAAPGGSTGSSTGSGSSGQKQGGGSDPLGGILGSGGLLGSGPVQGSSVPVA